MTYSTVPMINDAYIGLKTGARNVIASTLTWSRVEAINLLLF